MTGLLVVLLLVAAAVAVWFWLATARARRETLAAEEATEALREELEPLRRFVPIRDAEREAQRLLDEATAAARRLTAEAARGARRTTEEASAAAEELTREAAQSAQAKRAQAKARLAAADDRLGLAVEQAEEIVESARAHYLVVGDLGSDAWITSRFGTKIEKVLRYRDERSAPTLIVREVDFVRAVMRTPPA